MKPTSRQILQIIPATGWSARYKGDPGEGAILSPLICWALVKEEDDTFVVGMDGPDYADFADTTSNFESYIHESEADLIAAITAREQGDGEGR